MAEPLHEAMAACVGDDRVPGLVALVERRGRTEIVALGVPTRGQPGAVREDTIFRITSMTKPVAAVAALMLLDDGMLALDAPVARWLPELAHPRVLRRFAGPLDDTVPAPRAITVRDVLTFCLGSGMVMAAPDSAPILQATFDRFGFGSPAPDQLLPPDVWLQRFAELPLMHPPGTHWQYNTGAVVLGILLARAAGAPLDQLLRDRIFAPLGMTDTGFHVPPDKLARFTTAYVPDGHTLPAFDPPDGQWAHPPAHPCAADGLVSTARDFLRFARLVRSGGLHEGVRLVSEAAIAAMIADQLTPEIKARGALTPGFFDHHSWGLGLGVVTSRDELGLPAGSYGWDGGFGSSWWSLPDGTIGILLSNRGFDNPSPPAHVQAFWRHVTG